MPVEATDNEIRIRVISPNAFQRDSFRRIALSASRGIYAIVGRPKGSAKTRVQSLRFLKSKDWDKAKATEWAKSHGYSPKSYEGDDIVELAEGIELTPDDFETGIWAEWDEEKDLEPAEVIFKLVGPIESFEEVTFSDEELKEMEEAGIATPEEGKGFRIAGHANVACNEDGTPHVDRDHEIVEWQALADAIKGYMDNPVLRFMHRLPVGIVLHAGMDEMGLVVDAKLGRRWHDLQMDIEDNIYSSFSIGFRVREINEFCVAEGECFRSFTDIELLEISVVDIPANALSRFTPTKVYITGVDYTPSELVGEYVSLRGNKHLTWAGAGLVPEDPPPEPPTPPPNSPHTLTLNPKLQDFSGSPAPASVSLEPCCGEETINENTEGATMEDEETQEELAKALKEQEELKERLQVYEEKERLETEEQAFNQKVQDSVEAALEGKIPENMVTEDTMKSMFEEFLATQNGQRQSFTGDDPNAEGAIKTRDEAFEYLGDKYFSRVKEAGKPDYTKGDIEFELWLEERCILSGKTKHTDEMVHSIQKGGGITDPHFREAYNAIMKTTPDDYSSSSTPFGGAASASGLTFMPEGWADEIIDLVYELSFFRQLVTSMIMNEYKVHIPKLTGTIDYYQWTRSASEGGSDVTASAPTSDEVVLEIQTLLGSVPIGNAAIAYGVAGLGPGIKREMAKRLNWIELHSFINGDLTITTSYADNINGAYNDPDNLRGVDATHNTYKLMYNGLREHNFDAATAGEVTNVDASGATIANSHIREALKNLGVYGDNKADVVLLIPKAVEATILGWTELLTIDKYGPAATVVTGEVGKLFGVTVVSTSVLQEDLDSSGLRPATADVLTACIMFDKSSPIVGNPGPASRKFSITFDDEPKRDRFSLIPRNDVAFNVRRRDSIIQIYNLAVTVV